MNKPPAGPLSDLVRTCPQPSENSLDKTRREEIRTPLAPLRGERSDRARNGSRRQRDLQALAAERRTPPADLEPPTIEAQAAWRAIREELRHQVPPSAFESWLEPIELLGISRGALAIGCPDRVLDWFDRRYATLTGNAARQNGFAGVYASELVPAITGEPLR